MDTKVINVYNEKNQKLVGSGLIIVDAATEPLKVLKVLVEGLPDGRSGLWLTNFKGIPVARTLSPFDLVYLDPGYIVVHCVEISVEGEYEPFSGDPASALVLPPRSIASSRMQPGDRLLFRTVDPGVQSSSGPRPSRAPQKPSIPQPTASQPGGAHFFNSAFPIPPTDNSGTSLPGFYGGLPQGHGGTPSAIPGATASAEQSPTAQAHNTAISGRLTKSANSMLGTTPALRPSLGDEPQPGSREIGLGSATTVQTSPPPVEMAFSLRMPTRLMATPLELSGATEHIQDSQPTSSMQSGRLLRTVNLAPAILPEEELEPAPPVSDPTPTEAAAAAAPLPAESQATIEISSETSPGATEAVAEKEKPREPTLGIVIPITAAHSASVPHHIPTAAPETPATVIPIVPDVVAEPAASTALVPLETQRTPRAVQPVPAPVPQEFSVPESLAVAATAAVAPAQPSMPSAQPAANNAVAPVAPASYPRTQIKPAEKQIDLAISHKKKKPSWDVRLLYKLFPEFDPARPPEIRYPRLEERKQIVDDEEELSLKLQVLCWLYPDLQLDKVKQKRSEERRAVRLPSPGLVAYFFTGGAPRPHPIKDISVTGFYMCTNERWLPGTIVRVTLQMVDARPDGGRDSITVHSRVVRWGPDGGGFEFVLPGFLEQ